MSDEDLRSVVVVKKTLEANTIFSFELADPEGAELPAFTAGSHIDVTLPTGQMRQYSLLNSEKERNRYVIGVWKDPNSRGASVALHNVIKEGDLLQIGAPRNRFRAPKGVKRALLLARGIGVTPVLSLADHFQAQNIPFEFHYLNALGAPGAFKTLIESSAYADKAKFYLESAQEAVDPKTLFADQPEEVNLFICGVDWWIDPLVEAAKKAGFSPERIHIERFTGKAAAPLLDKVFDVKIASTGAIYKIPGDKSVSQLLEEKGVKIPTSCEQGMCGTCRVKVLEGEVDHRDKRLSEPQRAEGYFLACVSRAKGDLLVLDL